MQHVLICPASQVWTLAFERKQSAHSWSSDISKQALQPKQFIDRSISESHRAHALGTLVPELDLLLH